jgi:hypothetical protein
MPFHRTSAFWLGCFVFLFILFGWFDSLHCGRRWVWSHSGTSQLQIENRKGNLGLGFSSLYIPHGAVVRQYPVTSPIGTVIHSGANGKLRFGRPDFEDQSFTRPIFRSSVQYQERRVSLAIPHWLIALLWLPAWLGVSYGRARLIARKRTALILATDPRCFAPVIDPDERTEILEW